MCELLLNELMTKKQVWLGKFGQLPPKRLWCLLKMTPLW